jgi:hypothetical protein
MDWTTYSPQETFSYDEHFLNHVTLMWVYLSSNSLPAQITISELVCPKDILPISPAGVKGAIFVQIWNLSGFFFFLRRSFQIGTNLQQWHSANAWIPQRYNGENFQAAKLPKAVNI